jgi:hypothetical protein
MSQYKIDMGRRWRESRQGCFNATGSWGSCWQPVNWMSDGPSRLWTRVDLIAITRADHAEVWIWDSKEHATQKLVDVNTLKAAKQVIIALDKMAEIEKQSSR